MTTIRALATSNQDHWEDKGNRYTAYVLVPGIPKESLTVNREGPNIRVIGGDDKDIHYDVPIIQPADTDTPTITYQHGILVIDAHKRRKQSEVLPIQ